jgi:multicomponent Na+:H+ antiporter subunit A
VLHVLLAHAVAAVLAPTLVRRVGPSAFVVLAAVPAAGLVWTLLHAGTEQRVDVAWVPGLSLDVALRLDPLAAILASLVTGVGALVLLYCARYFDAGEARVGLFAALMVAFAGAMFGLVVSDNVLLLYTFWELTTVLSFLLVGHYAERATSRRAATQALLVTTSGGLAMLVGLIILGGLAGSYRLSTILDRAPVLLDRHAWLTGVALVLVLVGALSKSAIIPLHFWLPGAMAAPTPVSAYLHAAAMVKAGIYLVARLSPAFADAGAWRWTVVPLGLASMLVAGWRALREHDLKLVLAFGTVSQLGFLVVLVGAGTRNMALAGAAMVLAHALFKSTLFLVVGVIDHSTGTRDLRRLAGLGRRQPVLLVAAALAAASMAGLPPLVGFVGKEAALESLLHGGLPDARAALLTLAAVVLGSAFTAAYSLRFVWGAFADKGRPQGSPAVRAMHVPGPLFLAAPVLLAAGCLVAGLLAPLVDHALAPYADTVRAAPDEPGYHLALWHGLNPALGLSVLAVVAGVALFWAREGVEHLQFRSPALGNADRAYDASLRFADVLSLRLTGVTQRGSLPLNLTTILVTLTVVPTVFLVLGTDTGVRLRLADSPLQLAVGALAVVAALAATSTRNRLTGVLLVGLTGYAAGVVFAIHGAPDLALTQVLVETLTLVIFVLMLRKLPPDMQDSNSVGRRGPRAVLAVGVGTAITVVGAYAVNARTTVPVAKLLPDAAYTRGNGANVVNVLLVDIRAWDTLGEISVLLVAATGVASLVFRHRRTGTAPRVSDAVRHARPDSPDDPASDVAPDAGTTWLAGGRFVDARHRSLVLEVSARLVFPTVMVLSIYFLFSGHNAPGGGFAGGLVAGLALVVRYLAGGRYELGETLPVDAGLILGLGLLLAGGTAVASLFLGAPVLSSAVLEVTLPLLGDVKLVTALFFDTGVYLVVVGLVLDVLRSLGAGLDREALDEGGDDRLADSSPAVRGGGV